MIFRKKRNEPPRRVPSRVGMTLLSPRSGDSRHACGVDFPSSPTVAVQLSVGVPSSLVTQIHDLSAREQAAAIRDRELSPVDITEHYLNRIDRLSEQVGAYVTVTADIAREQAKAAEKAVMQGESAPLLGVPVPIKDLNMVKDVPMTLGSSVYDDFQGFADDHVVTFLREAGTILLGKTNTPEFGLPCYTENGVAPPARTPWDLSRSAGGSSGGAAAAVASGLAPMAQGSDGGGSIRIPSSVCGLFGIKPTRGRVSHGPIVPDLTGLSTNGPIARNVRDAALMLDIIAKNMPGDMYHAAPQDGTFLEAAEREPGRLRIARSVASPVPGAEVHPDCLAAYDAATELLTELGHEVEELDLPFDETLVPHFETLWAAMATLTPVAPDREERLLPLTRWLRERGKAVTAPELFAAQASLQLAVRLAMPVTNRYDVILHPTLAQPPVPIGYFDGVTPEENFERQKRFTPYTSLYNVSGQPAVSVPLHWTKAGLPIGVMLVGRMNAEATLISLSAQLEAARPWADRHPPIWD
ncbi:amidase [Actinoallomurus bryophytorum]|uniref:Amidase n=1 Tax=Actinoallomurus bryophytorum TaxID=1490222 RepID=A0A543CR90_9ACTN|nr:amidase [Actinoallomurus bryophytorum]